MLREDGEAAAGDNTQPVKSTEVKMRGSEQLPVPVKIEAQTWKHFGRDFMFRCRTVIKYRFPQQQINTTFFLNLLLSELLLL